MPIIKCRKKPITVEAIQLTETTAGEAMKWLRECGGDFHGAPLGLNIHTLEGAMTASWGDYIIKGVRGEFYPCRRDIFEETYVPALSGPEMTFSDALEEAKKGKNIARSCWNGKGMYVYLVPGPGGRILCEYVPEAGIVENSLVVPWLFSQADILAEDWVVVD